MSKLDIGIQTASLLGQPLDVDAVEDVGDGGLRGSCSRGRGRSSASVERADRTAIWTSHWGGGQWLVAGYFSAEMSHHESRYEIKSR